MLLDGQGRVANVHLLHDPGAVGVAMHGAATAGTSVEVVFLEGADLKRRERLTLVPGVAGLSTDLGVGRCREPGQVWV